MWQWIVFLVGTGGIVVLSRGSLGKRQAHGFYRFFAFEALLILVLRNVDMWFRAPFSLWQIVSWVLLLGSLFLAIHGFALLKRIGKPDVGIADQTRLGVEKTTQLVTSGAYRFIRHPLYASLLLLGTGIYLKQPELRGGLLLLVVVVALYATARVEEGENIRNFGTAYRKYMQKTKMFIPYIF